MFFGHAQMGDAILEQEGGQQQLKDVACVARGNEREREREKRQRGVTRRRGNKKKLGQVRQVTAPAVLSRGGVYGGTGFEGGRGGGGFIGEINTGRVIFFLLLRFETAKCS